MSAETCEEQMEALLIWTAFNGGQRVDIPALKESALDMWRLLRQMDAGQRGTTGNINAERNQYRIRMELLYQAILLSKSIREVLITGELPPLVPRSREGLKPGRKVELDLMEAQYGSEVDPAVLEDLVHRLGINTNALHDRHLADDICIEAMAIVFSGRLGDVPWRDVRTGD